MPPKRYNKDKTLRVGKVPKWGDMPLRIAKELYKTPWMKQALAYPPNAHQVDMSKYNNMHPNADIASNRVGLSRAVKDVGTRYLSTAKTRVVPTNDTVANDYSLICNSRTLYGMEISDIPRYDASSILASQNNPEVSRIVDQVNIKGFKIQMELTNKVLRPLWFNYGIVSAKNKTVSVSGGAIQEPYRLSALAPGFLRDYDESDEANVASDRASVVLNHSPINTDLFHVLKHDRFLIGAIRDTTPYELTTPAQLYAWQTPGENNKIPSYRYIEKYFPINKQFAYDDAVNDNCETPLFFVYWCDELQRSGGWPAEPVLDVQIHPVTFFDDKSNI